MEKSTVREICVLRLGSWTEILVEHYATPFALVGVGHNDSSGELRVCMCEGIGDEAVAEILRAAADQIDP